MAFILDAKPDDVIINYYIGNRDSVQRDFCSLFESEKMDSLFGKNEKILAYLKSFGIDYCGNFTFKSDDWGYGRSGKRFITAMNYTLQLGCCILAWKESLVIGMLNHWSFDPRFLAPITRERDIYFLETENRTISGIEGFLHKLMEHGGIVKLNGKTYSKNDVEDVWDFCDEYGSEFNVLTKEIDAKYYDPGKTHVFGPFECSLAEYIRWLYPNTSNDVLNDISLDSDWCKNAIDMEDIRVKVNRELVVTGERYQDLYYLYEKNGEIYFQRGISVKHPAIWEIIYYGVLRPDIEGKDGVESRMVLVLDSDYVDARKYQDHIWGLFRYDKEKKELEICDMSAGAEFHELLQQSKEICDL